MFPFNLTSLMGQTKLLRQDGGKSSAELTKHILSSLERHSIYVEQTIWGKGQIIIRGIVKICRVTVFLDNIE